MKKALVTFFLIISFVTMRGQQGIKYLINKENGNIQLLIYKNKVAYIDIKGDTISYKTNKILINDIESIEIIKDDNSSFKVVFENENTIKIIPYNLIIKVNDKLYNYVKKAILEKNEIQKLSLIFYPINRYYDDGALYFNQDIFIEDWDTDIYSERFKIFSVLQYDEDENLILKGIYEYQNDTLKEINYFTYQNGDFFNFYNEKLFKMKEKNNSYQFNYNALNEKYIIKGFHFRNKNGKVTKAKYEEEYMSDLSKSKKKIFTYPYPKVFIKTI